jgi:hypothetical protein
MADIDRVGNHRQFTGEERSWDLGDGFGRYADGATTAIGAFVDDTTDPGTEPLADPPQEALTIQLGVPL